ncbi:hypothetical protein JT359_07230 [Candidatus Poribacteria bacterium]|nr:hypothetical protein [Candidatus Poribacteria bacterium]
MKGFTRFLLSLPVFFITILFFSLINSAYTQTESQNQDSSLKLPTFSIINKTEKIKIDPDKLVWTLKHPPIVENSEEIRNINGDILERRKDYKIDYASGSITFDKSIDEQKVFEWIITYRSLPFNILKIYKRDIFKNPLSDVTAQEQKEDSSPDLVNQPKTSPAVPSSSSSNTPSQLEYSGSRTFGISVGSGRALSQNQEFRINVRGNVSDNIQVLAILSDQDLPIQPEGMTEDIQDINQKLIRITHPNVIGTLGDFDASLGPSEFIFFPRALEGVKVEGDFDWGKFHLIPSALPKGQSTSKVIRGEEGRSEYRLNVDDRFVIVKAGSEIVWLNGEKMRRGENNDYIIREYGDPIIEFNSKHLITSNDVIRVDFEYIPEDRIYQQNLYGLNSVFTLPREWLSFGASYAVEADIDDPEQALVLFDDEDLQALRENTLDPDGDGFLLTPPQKHTVWGLESRLNLTEQTWINCEMAFSGIDKNTYSTNDRKDLYQAWKLIGYTGWEIPTWSKKFKPKLIGNIDVRAMDANFLPVGASSSNRNRDRYGTQYATEGFEDALLFDPGVISQANDEKTLNLDFKLLPYQWLQFALGGGRSVEEVKEGPTTLKNNFNWGANFTPRSSSGSTNLPIFTRGTGFNRTTFQPDSVRSPTTIDNSATNKPAEKTPFLRRLPNIRWNNYQSTSIIEENSVDTGIDENIQKSRQEGSLSYLLSPFEFLGTSNRFTSIDDYTASRNRRRNRSSGSINLVEFKWVSMNTSYELEQTHAKEPLLNLDDEYLGISDWMRATTARTWKVGLFSQQAQWVNLKTNLARRMVKAHSNLGTDTTTQLADTTLHFTPFNRAVDAEITYELDKKLTTQRREFYTDIHPLTGHRIQPGEGFYVRLDDLRYVEDTQEGTYIKIYQNVGDKPTTAVDASFRLRLQPRLFLARRARNQINTIRTQSIEQNLRTPTTPANTPKQVDNKHNLFTWFLNALRIQTRLWLTEEQEAEDAISLYLLQDLQDSQTLFGRINQHHRMEISPSPRFSFEVNFRTGRSLNRRINTQERHRNYRTWDIAFSLNPTKRLSIGANWEQRREEERYSQLNLSEFDEINVDEDPNTDVDDLPPIPISDLHQYERTTELKLQYEISRAIRWSGVGGYNRTIDTEQLDEEPDAKTRTFSFENQFIYSIFGKGRIEINHKLGYGKSDGGIPFAQYYFYEGVSHDVRTSVDYKLRKFTDLLFRFNYRLLSTKQRKPEHRLEMTVSAEL